MPPPVPVLRVLIRHLGNVGVVLFVLYFLHLAQRSFGPRRKVLSRQYRKSAITDFAPERPPTLSRLASEVTVTSEARIHRSLTGVGSEEPTTTVARLLAASQNRPHAVAFMDYQDEGGDGDGDVVVWRPSVTWHEYYARSRRIASRLLLGRYSVQQHDVVLFVSESRPEFFLAWMAVQMLGAVCTSAHAWSSFEEMDACVRVTSPVLCFVDREDLACRLREAGRLEVVYIGNAAQFRDEMEKGEEEEDSGLAVDERIANIRPGHASQILFSSGQQTVTSKPYLLSHDNVTFSARALLQHHENTSRWGRHAADSAAASSSSTPPSDVNNERICSFLPLSHVGALAMDLHVPMCLTATQSYQTACTTWTLHKRSGGKSGPRNLLFSTLKQCRPTLFLGMPAVWDRIHRALQAKMGGGGRVLALAMDSGKQWFRAVQAGGHGTQPLSLYYAERWVLNSIKRQFGLDRCKLLMSSGAPIASQQLEFFGSLGLHIMEIFGATGCSGPHSMGRQDYFVCGTVGVGLPSCEIKLEKDGQDEGGEEGEICVRGRHVCMGVLNDAETTNRVIDSDGFFHTNHIGRIDRFGCIQLVGRRDELVVGGGGGGEGQPQRQRRRLGLNQIEAIVRDRARPLVERVVVVAASTAAVLRVFVTLRQQPQKQVGGGDGGDGDLLKRIQRAVDEANGVLRGVCVIEHFYVLPVGCKFTSFGPDAELTHSGQARRSVVRAKYERELRVLTSAGFSSSSQQ